jgi:hypothetical protein
MATPAIRAVDIDSICFDHQSVNRFRKQHRQVCLRRQSENPSNSGGKLSSSDAVALSI